MVLMDVIFFTIAPLRLAVGVSDTFTAGALTITLDTTGTVGCALLLLARGVDDCFTTTVDLIDGVDLTTSEVDAIDGNFNWKLLKLKPFDEEVVVVIVEGEVVVVVEVVGLISSILGLEIATGDGFTSDLL
jgi:hypothetical protein